MHGAWYVSDDHARQFGMIGRSWGCPALPQADAPAVIDAIKGGTFVYAYAAGASAPSAPTVMRASLLASSGRRSAGGPGGGPEGLPAGGPQGRTPARLRAGRGGGGQPDAVIAAASRPLGVLPSEASPLPPLHCVERGNAVEAISRPEPFDRLGPPSPLRERDRG